MEENIKPRFEFRCFAPDLSATEVRLFQMSECCEECSSIDIYILSKLTVACNVKFRNGMLDVKLLHERRSRLELWQPLLSCEFPIRYASLVQVATCLGVDLTMLGPCCLDWPEFRALVDGRSELASIRITKHRKRFSVPGGFAEVVGLVMDGSRIQSAAVESEVCAIGEDLIGRAGLGGRANTSYPCYLRAFAFE